MHCEQHLCLVLIDKRWQHHGPLQTGDIVAFEMSRELSEACTGLDTQTQVIHRVQAAPGELDPLGKIVPAGFFWEAGDGPSACNSAGYLDKPELVSSIQGRVLTWVTVPWLPAPQE